MFHGIATKDEDLDVLTAGRGANRIAWYENLTASAVEIVSTPFSLLLDQNCPNPFNSNTMIRYRLVSPESVRLVVYDLAGRVVTTLVDGRQNSGDHEVKFEGTDLPSGTYFYELCVGEQRDAMRMLFIK